MITKILIIAIIFSFLVPVGDSAPPLSRDQVNKSRVSSLKSVEDPYQIHLKSRKFKPKADLRAVLGQRFSSQRRSADSRIHVLIQFKQIPDKNERAELRRLGIKLLSYIPNNAWLASVDQNKMSQAVFISNIRWVGTLKPEDKISPSILKGGVAKRSRNTDGSVNISVIIFSDVETDTARDILEKYGNTTEHIDENRWSLTLNEDRINDLAKEDIVQWIEEPPPPRTPLNNGLRAAIGADNAQASPYNLNGTGVVVAEWDNGVVQANHSDLLGRVTVRDTGVSVSGHATHVAGTLIGNGNLSGGTYRGVAPNATLVSYLWPNSLTELDSETNDSIVNYSAVISQNSWGWAVSYTNGNCADHGDYDSWSQRYDDIVRGRLGKRITVVFAAGNEEDDGDCPPYPWNQTTAPGGTAKNTISVGASYSDTNGHAVFSSRGPTDDGRIKPDLTAPGDEVGGDGGIKSTYPPNTYAVGAGTSMAAPAVSGAAALLYQDYRSTHGNSDPLPSTIKALLIHTAVDLNNTGPDYTFGWGLINVTAAIDVVRDDTSSNDIIREGNITAQGDYDEYSVTVLNGSSDLKITLVWDDYPGTPNAAKTLVNDLDLVVTAPNGTRYYPWVLDPGNPSANATTGVDKTNNVEQVYVASPAGGNWSIRINGTTVPYPNQTYSLILGIPQDTTPPKITILSPANTTYTSQAVHLNVTADENISTWWYSLNSGPNTTFTPNTTIVATLGPNNLTVYANDSRGNMNSSTVYFTFAIVKNNNTGAFYTGLQEAINNATAGDTILIYKGNLSDNVDVNKSVSVVGVNSSSVKIRALNASRHVFNITSSNVTIKDLTITGATNGKAGIYLNGASNASISNSNLTGNYYGIFLYGSSDSSILNNSISSNTEDGIYLYFSSNTTLINNTIAANTKRGIYLELSRNITMRNNTLVNNTYNFGINASPINYLIHDIDSSNTVDGKPVYYRVNIQNQEVPTDAGYVGIINSTNVTVKNLSLSRNYQGVFFAYTNNSKIQNVSVANNYYGVLLRSSFNNTLVYNNLSSNSFDFVSVGSYSNTLSTNFFNNTKANFTYSGDIKVSAFSSSINDPDGLYNIGKYLNITNATSAWIYMNITYADFDVLSVEESTLRLYRYNGSWMNITGSGVNEDNNFVYANVTDFSVFAPLGEKDTSPPLITIHSPTNATLADQTPLLNATFNEVVNYTWYSLDDASNSTPVKGVSNLSLNLSTLSEGTHSISVYANDSAGNLNSTKVYFTVDVSAPNVYFNSPRDITYYNSSVFLNLSITDSTGVNATVYSVDAGANKSYTGPVWITGLSNGTHDIVVFSNDSAGNLNITNVSFSLDFINESVSKVVNASGSWGNVTTSLVYINLSTTRALVGNVNVSSYAAPPPGVNVSLAVQRYMEINVSDNLNATSGNLTWAYIRFNYTDSDVTGLDESTLRLYWWNPSAKKWTRLIDGTNLTALGGPYVYDSGVNTTGNYVYVNVSHFSIYGISGSTPTTIAAAASGGGGGGGGISVNTSDLAYFKEIFRYNTLILVPDLNVSEDWEAAILIREWFLNRSYSVDVKLVSDFDRIRDEDRPKIFIGGHVSNPYSAEIGIDVFFTREASNEPWLINGEPYKGVIKLYETDPLSITGRGKVLVIAGTDRKQTLRITQSFLEDIEKQESLTAKKNKGTQLIL